LWGKETYPLYYEIKQTEVENSPAGYKHFSCAKVRNATCPDMQACVA
jgi:hypothetical protein